MANRWGNNGNSERLYFGGASKITSDGDCSCEMKRCLLLGRKSMTNLESILKSRDITLLTKVRLIKAMVFPVVMYGCESWTIKKTEHWRINAFELRCWRRLLRVTWMARRSIQSILKEISPEYSLEGLMLKLKFQYFGHLMRRTNSVEKTLMLGKNVGGGRRGWQRMKWLGGITDSMDMSWVYSGISWWIESSGVLYSMGFQRVRHDWATELTDWLIYVTKLNIHIYGTIVTAQSISCVWFFATQWTVACQTPLSTGFPRQEYWSVLPFPSREISLLGIKPTSLALSGRFFAAEPPGKCPHIYEKVEHSLLQSFHPSFFGSSLIQISPYISNHEFISTLCFPLLLTLGIPSRCGHWPISVFISHSPFGQSYIQLYIFPLLLYLWHFIQK